MTQQQATIGPDGMIVCDKSLLRTDHNDLRAAFILREEAKPSISCNQRA